jgi:hypothetical protein
MGGLRPAMEKESKMLDTVTRDLQSELDSRIAEGNPPMTVAAMQAAFAALGYRLDRSMDCRHVARWMTGARAGCSYPAISTGVSEADTGLSAFNGDARRDENFRAMQEMRLSGRVYAVSNGAILEA